MSECQQCGQWKIKDTDDYCGYCGFLQLPISIEPLDLTLISGIVAEDKIIFRNNGYKDLDVEILPSNHSYDWLSFFPSNLFTLAAEDSMEINVRLNDEEFPGDVAEEKLKFVCMLDNDKRKTINLSVTAKAGPRPAVLVDDIQFGDVEIGRDSKSWAEIKNKGGVPLQFKEVMLEGSNQFRVEAKNPWESLNPNEELKIPVIWKSPQHDPNLEQGKVGLRIKFKNYPEELFIPIKGNLFRFKFGVEPTEIVINDALSKEKYSRKVTLVNKGTKDIEVTAIESDKEWIQIVCSANSFTLLCRDSTLRKIAAGPTVFLEFYNFEVVFSPKDLKEGWNTGKVTIHTTNKDTYLELDIQLNVIRPKECNEYIGIDFGTTNSVVAIWNGNNIVLVADQDPETNSSTPLIPSILVFHGRPDNYKIGREAEREADVFPDFTVRSIKRVMGYGNNREFFGKNFSPEDLATLIIKKLIEFAERRLFEINKEHSGAYLDIKKAIVTVPANFYDLQIRGILTACKNAGIDIEEKQVKEASQKIKELVGKDINAGIILDEPTAAALFYLSWFQEKGILEKEFEEKFKENRSINFLIFDYGGGTLDVSVVQVSKLNDNNIGIKVLANKGDNQIGGDSIDIFIMKQLLNLCKNKEKFKDFDDSLIRGDFNELEKRRQQENWDKKTWPDVLRARADWKKAAENLKIAFDEKEGVEFRINRRGNVIFSINNGKINYIKSEFIQMVKREEVTEWIIEILNKAQTLVPKAFEFIGIGPESIDYVIHTGRSSLMPEIQANIEKLFSHLQKEHIILDKENLKVCVAKGAALYGLMRTGIQKEQQVRLVSEGRRLPHSYGIHVMKGFKPVFEHIIPSGTEYPTEETKHYDEVPGQRYLTLRFLQNSGENNNINGNPDVRTIGSITIDTLADGKPGCDVKYMFDANRKMEVSADGRVVEIEPARLEEEERWIG
jgi:molecular chaperone DnaK